MFLEIQEVNLKMKLPVAILMMVQGMFIGHIIGDVPDGEEDYLKEMHKNLLEVEHGMLSFMPCEEVKACRQRTIEFVKETTTEEKIEMLTNFFRKYGDD